MGMELDVVVENLLFYKAEQNKSLDVYYKGEFDLN